MRPDQIWVVPLGSSLKCNPHLAIDLKFLPARRSGERIREAICFTCIGQRKGKLPVRPNKGLNLDFLRLDTAVIPILRLTSIMKSRYSDR